MKPDIWLQLLFFIGACGWSSFSLLSVVLLVRYRVRLPDNGLTGVSVVVAARNEADNLRKHLPMLLAQDHRPLEIVVVDDRSGDGSGHYLDRMAERHAILRVVHVASTPSGMDPKKHALLQGASAAAHDILLFTDADCAPESPHWARTMAAPFAGEATEIVLGYSQYRKAGGVLNPFIRFETLTTGLTYSVLSLAGMPYMGVGRNIAHRRSCFLGGPGYGPFRGVTGGDDDLLVQRSARRGNTALVLHRDAVVYSVPKRHLQAYMKQKIRHLSTGIRYRARHRVVLGGLFFVRFLFWTAAMAAFLSGFATTAMGVAFVLTHLCSLAAILLFKRQTADKTPAWMFPLLEFIYIFYYLSAGLAVLCTKKIRWN